MMGNRDPEDQMILEGQTRYLPPLPHKNGSMDSYGDGYDSQEEDLETSSPRNATYRGRLSNNFLLFFVSLLYFLQGMPMGLAQSSIPLLLKGSSSFTQIGIFSFVLYPYSLKLL